MPTPPYPPSTHDVVTKEITVSLNPGETVTLVTSGSNGFFANSKSFSFGDSSEDIQVAPVNAPSPMAYPFVVTSGLAHNYVDIDDNGEPLTLSVDGFEIKNTSSSATTITVYQIGYN
jgi:hypothetical protein